MERIDTAVVGAGQAGLAVSQCLTSAGREHVLFERGSVAERWRGRWPAQRVLTPNWMSRLPGWSYQGADPDGFMALPELVNYFIAYARSFAAPVLPDTAVRAVVTAPASSHRVITSRGEWRARNVVIAAGACDEPVVPAVAGGLARELHQMHAGAYRGADKLPPGGVLVVGASSSGLQIADEANRAGRQVVVSVGAHRRAPRRYRGMDIWWWLDRIGLLDRTVEQLPETVPGRHDPSLQLAAAGDLDLGLLSGRGVQLVGRLLGAASHQIALAQDLAATTTAADAQLRLLLRQIDADVEQAGLGSEVLDPEPFRPVVPPAAPAALDLRAAGIRTVVWATGYRYSYPWLRVPVRDDAGRIRHQGGVTTATGLYLLGLPLLSRRNSHFIDGVRHDARRIAAHICGAQPGQGRLSARSDADPQDRLIGSAGRRS